MRRFFICFLLFLFFFIWPLKASTIYYDDSGTVSYEQVKTDIKDLYGHASFIKESGKTTRSNANYPQNIKALTMKTNNQAKLVAWAIPNSKNDGFIRRPVSDIARDYEAKHAGWSVIGGINADQYATKYGENLSAEGSDYFYPQPYYPMIADYEKWFSVPVLPYGAGNIVGFLNDGSNDQLLYQKTTWNYNGIDKAGISGLFLSIIDDNGKVISKYPLSGYNSEPKINESSLYTPFYTGPTCPPLVVSGENLFIVSKADLAFASNSSTYTYKDINGQNAFFGKGRISDITSQTTLTSGSFAISTKNSDVLNSLTIGTYIKVQFEFDTALNECEAGIGFHTIMRNNNKDVPSQASYNTRAYPRSIFGRKDDGTIVLMSIDGSNSAPTTGANQQEAQAILKRFGVVEAYQMDGGGSVTMVTKEEGQVKTVNSPSEGEARHVFSALLFVIKDIEVECQAQVGVNQVTLQTHLLDQSLGRLFIKLNNERKEVINNTVTFTNLQADTVYQYEYIVFQDEIYRTFLKTGQIKTIKNKPFVKACQIILYNNELYFEIDIYDPNNAVTRKNLQFNKDSFLIAKKQVVISNYQTFTIDGLHFLLSYDINDGKGRIDEYFTDFKITCSASVIFESAKNTLSLTLKDFFK